MSAGMVYDLAVHYEDGATVRVKADQRDVVAFEIKFDMGLSAAMERRTVLFFRYIAWHALRRTKNLDLTSASSSWDLWGETVVEVEVDPESPSTPDPTSPARPAGS